uniref:Uncharacterized protein n=1 Tax=viral metagenome TaxID=1070528 RepID=A0A6M3KC75_9ZZZZ
MRSKESIIAELDARKVGYSEDMSYNELNELLKEAQAKDVPEPKPTVIDYSGVRCGLSTIQELWRRVTILERNQIEVSRLRKNPV